MEICQLVFFAGDTVQEREMTLKEQEEALTKRLHKTQALIDLEQKNAGFRETSFDHTFQLLKEEENLTNLILNLRERQNAEQNKLNEGIKTGTTLTVEQVETRQKLQAMLEKSVPEIDKLNDLLKEVDGFIGLKNEDGELLFTEADLEKIRAYINELIVLEQEGENTIGGIEQMQQAIQNLSTQFTSNFVDSLLSGQDALKSFRDFAKNMVNQILTIFLQMEVVNRILQGIFPNAGIKAGGIITEQTASGGRISGPRMVGERGPELFVPDSTGLILNNMNTKNALSGGQGVVINQSVNFATGVQATVRNEVLQLMPQIATVTKAAVSQSAERSLRYRGSLKNA